mgnify:CR=1 FL=1
MKGQSRMAARKLIKKRGRPAGRPQLAQRGRGLAREGEHRLLECAGEQQRAEGEQASGVAEAHSQSFKIPGNQSREVHAQASMIQK